MLMTEDVDFVVFVIDISIFSGNKPSLGKATSKSLSSSRIQRILARCLGNKLQSGGYLKSNNYTTLLYELIDLVKEMYNSTSRVT